MAKKSKLLSALDAHKGKDFKAERERKLRKVAEKKKRSKSQPADEQDRAIGLGSDDGETQIDEEARDNPVVAGSHSMSQTDQDLAQSRGEGANWIDTKARSAIQNGGDEEAEDVEQEGDEDDDEDEDGDEDDDAEDIPLSDLSEEDRADTIPHQRLTTNNTTAIANCLKRISYIKPKMPFSVHQSLISPVPLSIPDPNDDLTRELAFYSTCLSAAQTARTRLKEEDIPFSRPGDYFAEMVKSDEHMGKVKKKMYDEAAAKEASKEARKQRHLKKFGKAVQVAKEQERAKARRETLEKVKGLKRKRKGTDTGAVNGDADLFDIALEDGLSKPDRRNGEGGRGKGNNFKRQKRDQKFGFGGKKRFAKSGDAVSSADMRGFSVGKMKPQRTGAAKRLGKNRRARQR